MHRDKCLARKAAEERMRELIFKAVRERGVDISAVQPRKACPPAFKALVYAALPNHISYHSAQISFARILRGQQSMSPRSKSYYNLCYALNIDPYAAGYTTVRPERIIPPVRGTVKKHIATLRQVKDAQLHWLSCQRFHWLVLRGVKARGLYPESKHKKDVVRWQGFLTHIAPTGRARGKLTRFIQGKADITPKDALYWRLCKALDIPSNKAAFDYKVREGIDVDRL